MRLEESMITDTYLALNISNTISREGVLVQRDFRFLQVSQETKFALQQEQQTFPSFARSRGPTHSMYVITRVIGRVVLNNPINFRDIKTSRSYVCAE